MKQAKMIRLIRNNVSVTLWHYRHSPRRSRFWVDFAVDQPIGEFLDSRLREFRTRKTAETFIDVSTHIIAGRRAAQKGTPQ
jgi:hypothetical protein